MEQENIKHKTKIGLYWKFFEQLATNGMQFIVGIIMARLLSPSDFGIAALPAVFIAIAQVFIEGGFGLALVRKSEVTEKDLSTSFYYSIIVGISCYLALYFAAPLIADFYDTPVLTSLVRVTALTFLWSPLATPQSVILQRKLDFKTPARISVINKILSAIIGISVALAGYGIWALVISTLCANLFGLIQTWWAVKWFPKEKWSKESFRYLWDFGNKMMGVSLLNTLYTNIVPIIVGKTSGATDLGILNRARGFASLPSSQLTGVLTSVSFPVLSKFQDNNNQLSVNYRKMIKTTSFVVFPLMSLMSALSYPLIIALVTEKWVSCVILLKIMCFTYMLQPVQILNVNLLQVKGRTDILLKLEIIKKVIGAIVFIIASQFGLLTVCIVDFCYTIFALFCNTHYTGILLGLNIVKQLKDMLPNFLLSLFTMGIVYGVTYIISNIYFQLVVGTFIGVLLYVGVAYIMKFKELQDVKYMLNKKI